MYGTMNLKSHILFLFCGCWKIVFSQNAIVRDDAVSRLLLLLSEVTRIILFTKGKNKEFVRESVLLTLRLLNHIYIYIYIYIWSTYS